jgi:hypothetical protein
MYANDVDAKSGLAEKWYDLWRYYDEVYMTIKQGDREVES